MIYLLDTTAFSDVMSADPRTQARSAALTPTDSVMTCGVVLGEVLYGIHRLAPGKRRSQLEHNLARAVLTVPVKPVPVAAAEHYAVTKRECHRGGVAINENDLWIAATTLALGATLVTRDADFGRVRGLTTENWRS